MYLYRMKVNLLPEAHIYKPEIRFVDIDAAGIVNNATYLNYFEQSRIQFFEEIVGKKWDWNSAGMVIAKHEVNYRQPIFFQDDVTIVTWIERVGTKSMEAAYEAAQREESERRDAERGGGGRGAKMPRTGEWQSVTGGGRGGGTMEQRGGGAQTQGAGGMRGARDDSSCD